MAVMSFYCNAFFKYLFILTFEKKKINYIIIHIKSSQA